MEKEITKLKGGKKTDYEIFAQYILIAFLLLVIIFNGTIAFGSPTGAATSIGIVSAQEIIPSGMPKIYGEELGISYDDVNPADPRLADQTISKMREFEDLELNEAQMTRYINTLSQISCEYCCGAESIIFPDGRRACGCAHSFAMRGLTKYLLINHPEVSDEEILTELGKWKVLFFPGIHEQKAQVMEEKGIDPSNYIDLTSNKYRGIEKGQTSGGGMVGGC